MLKFCSLYSGSSGNCLFVETKNTKILIDCGTSLKKICTGLVSIDSSIEEIDAILVTHEHSDHIQSLGMISEKYDIPVLANSETWESIPNQKKKIASHNINIFENDTDFKLNELTIHPFSTPHDAVNPCGFNIHNGKKKISIATDLGHVDNKLIKEFEKSSFILLESNYEPEILQVSKYPFILKRRISGPNGHLSNIEASQAISTLISKDLKEVMLGHLSKENNVPELAYQTVVNELIENNIDINNLRLSVANRYNPSKIVNI